jgi:hypothetical protein
MSNPTTIVRQAIYNTKEQEPAHWRLCLENRSDTKARLGSYIPKHTPEQIDMLLERLQWEIYTHADVIEPAQAFIARNVRGRFGMMQIGDVPGSAVLKFITSKEKDKVEVVWEDHGTEGVEVDFLVLLVGPGDKDDIVWTFHPGDPIRPSTVNRYWGKLPLHSADQLGRRVSKEDAATVGIKWVKLG